MGSRNFPVCPTADDLESIADLFDSEERGPPPGFIELERLSEPSPAVSTQQSLDKACLQAIDVHQVRRMRNDSSQCVLTIVFGSTVEKWWVRGSYVDLLRKLREAIEQGKGK